MIAYDIEENKYISVPDNGIEMIFPTDYLLEKNYYFNGLVFQKNLKVQNPKKSIVPTYVIVKSIDQTLNKDMMRMYTSYFLFIYDSFKKRLAVLN